MALGPPNALPTDQPAVRVIQNSSLHESIPSKGRARLRGDPGASRGKLQTGFTRGSLRLSSEEPPSQVVRDVSGQRTELQSFGALVEPTDGICIAGLSTRKTPIVPFPSLLS